MSEAQAAFVARHIKPASDAHYAVMFTPEAQRTAAAAAFAFFDIMRELLHIQNDVAPTKVTWWHEELGRMRSGEPVHPVCQPLVAHRSDALHDAMNSLLHGAVMDFNQVDVSDETLNDYLRMRGGGLHQMLHAICGENPDTELVKAKGQCLAVAELLREARDPAFTQRPNAELRLSDGDSDAALEARLRAVHDQATQTIAAQPLACVPSTIHFTLTEQTWPSILATPFGETVSGGGAWRTLWTAWRTARRTQSQGSNT